MDRQSLKNIFTRTGCIPLDTLLRYRNCEMPERECNEAERHLTDCPLCSETIELLGEVDIREARKVTASVTHRIGGGAPAGQNTAAGQLIELIGPYWKYAAAAVLVIGTGLSLLLVNTGGKKEELPIAETPTVIPEPVSRPEPVPTVATAPDTLTTDTMWTAAVPVDSSKIKEELRKQEKLLADQDKQEKDKEKEKTDEEQKPKNGKEKKKNGRKSEEPVSEDPVKNKVSLSVQVLDKFAILPSPDDGGKKKRKSKKDYAYAGGTSEEKPAADMSTLPEFEGGDDQLKNYLKQNIQVPENYEGEEGTAVVSFIVNSDGKVGDVTLVKGIPQMNDVILTAVKNMPAWKAKEGQKGEKLRMNIQVKVTK